MNRTQLAHGQINGRDDLTIVLDEPGDMPASITINWPMDVSVTEPGHFPAVASTVARIFATAATRLAAIKPERRL